MIFYLLFYLNGVYVFISVYICHDMHDTGRKFMVFYALLAIAGRSKLDWWLAEGRIDLTGGVHEGVHICLCDVGLSLQDL